MRGGSLTPNSRPTQILADTCKRAKPFPDPYLRGLEVVGVAAAEALAFEDSPAGVSSAVAARIATVGVMTSQSDEALRAQGCVLTISSYRSPQLWSLLGL